MEYRSGYLLSSRGVKSFARDCQSSQLPGCAMSTASTLQHDSALAGLSGGSNPHVLQHLDSNEVGSMQGVQEVVNDEQCCQPARSLLLLLSVGTVSMRKWRAVN